MSVREIMAKIDASIKQYEAKVAALRKEWHSCREKAWKEMQDDSATHAWLKARDGDCDFDYVEAAADHRRATNRYNRYHQKAWRIVAELMELGEEPTAACPCGSCAAWRHDHLARFRAGDLGESNLTWISKQEAAQQAASWKAEAEAKAEQRWEAERERRSLAADREALLWR